MSMHPQPVLVLCSHGRSPPLNPPPDLKYDLRKIPNPPKALRDVSDGRSKRLREHLLSEEKFVTRLNEVEEEIKGAMQGKLSEWERQGKEEPSNVPGTSAAATQHEDNKSDCQAESDDAKDFETDQDRDPRHVVLRVGCNCALGHHRSVAFVSELAARPWPKEWEVEVIHRDLEKKRASGARTKQKSAWKDKRRGACDALGDAEEWHG